MQVLLDTKWYERKFFVDAAIAAEDIRILDEAKGYLGYSLDTNFVLIGHKERCKIYEQLIREKVQNCKTIRSIYEKDAVDQLAIDGARAILAKAIIEVK